MNIAKTLANLNTDRTSEYDTQATVVRTEDGIAWVNIKGGNPETPCQMTIDCKAGDIVKIHVGNGKAWIVGNLTAPPTNDKKTRERLNELEIDHAIFKKSITVDNIIGTSGWINLGNGTFNYGNQLVWDGKQLVIQGDAKFTGKLEGATGSFSGEVSASKLYVQEFYGDENYRSCTELRTNDDGLYITHYDVDEVGDPKAGYSSILLNKNNGIELYSYTTIQMQAQCIELIAPSQKYDPSIIINGNTEITGSITASGNIIAGTASDTSEHQVKAQAAAGTIYLFSQGSSTGTRGLYGYNSSEQPVSILNVASDNTVTLNGHASKDLALSGGTVTGNLIVNGTFTSKNGVYAHSICRPADNAGNINLGSNTNPWYNLYLSHCVYYTNPPTGGGTAVYINSNGAIVKYSSDRRLKNSIAPVEEDTLNPERLYDLPIYQYKYNNDVMEVGDDLYDKLVIGIMADEVDKIYPRACAYDSEGVPTGWNGNVLLPAMLKLIQDQNHRIKKLENLLQASA